MEDNQPVTANGDADFDHIMVGNGIMIPVGSRNIDGMVASLHTQDPTNGADFERLMAQSQNESWEEIEKRRALIFAATGKPPQIFGKDVD